MVWIRIAINLLISLIVFFGSALGSVQESQEVPVTDSSPDAAATTSEEAIIQAQMVLFDPESPLPAVRQAVADLLRNQREEPLAAQLRETSTSKEVRLAILEGSMSAGVDVAVRWSLFADVLALGANDGELGQTAQRFTRALHESDPTTFQNRLRGLLMQPELDSAVITGAARAAGDFRLFGLVDALVDRLGLNPPDNESLSSAFLESLRTLTLEDFGSDVDAWRQWYQGLQFATREKLLEEKLIALEAERARDRQEIVDLWQDRLRESDTEGCLKALGHELGDIRLMAARRLELLAGVEGGVNDEALLQAKEPLEQRIRLDSSSESARAPATGEELAILARVYAQLAAKDPHARTVLLDRFLAESEGEVRRTLLESLVIVVAGASDGPISRALEAAAGETTDSAMLREYVAGLGKVGDADALNAVFDHCHPDRQADAGVREVAVEAAVQISIRGEDAAPMDRVFRLLLNSLKNDPSGPVRTIAGKQLTPLLQRLPSTRLDDAFLSLRVAIDQSLDEDGLVDTLSRSMCRLPGFAGRSLQAMSDWLNAEDERTVPDHVLDIFLTRLLDLTRDTELSMAEQEMALRIAVQSLPEGGRMVTPDNRALKATQTLRLILEKSKESGAADMRETAASICREERRFAWAADLLKELLEDEEAREAVASRRAELEWRRCQDLLSFLRLEKFPADLRARKAEEAWDLLRSGLADGNEPSAKREKRLRGLVLTGSFLPERRTEAAQYGADVLASIPADDPSRTDLVARTAELWLRAGERQKAHDLLQREFPQEVPTDILILKARSAAEATPESRFLAMTYYQELLGPHGSGARIDPSHREFVTLVLDLVQLYVDARQWDDASQTLQSASLRDVATGLGDRRDRLQRQLESARADVVPANGHPKNDPSQEGSSP